MSDVAAKSCISLNWLIVWSAAGPFAWCAQMILTSALASYACYPDAARLGAVAPRMGWAPNAIGIIELSALTLCAAGAVFCFHAIRVMRDDSPGTHADLLEVGEGVPRVLAICGLLTALGFMLATLFDSAAMLTVPFCGG